MSNKDISTAETAQSDQYHMAAHQHIHYNKLQNQPYQQHTLPKQHVLIHPRTPSRNQQQGAQYQQCQQPQIYQDYHQQPTLSLSLAQQQQDISTLRKSSVPHLKYQDEDNCIDTWIPLNDGSSQYNNKYNLTTSNSNKSIGSGSMFLTPSDIPPPPPPNPINKVMAIPSTNKRLPNDRHRCKCEHAIEIIPSTNITPDTPATSVLTSGAETSFSNDDVSTPFHYHQQQQQQQQQPCQQQKVHSCNFSQSGAEHLTPPPPPLSTPRDNLYHSQFIKRSHHLNHHHTHHHPQQQQQQQQQNQQSSHQQKHHHHHLHRNPDHLLLQAKQEASHRLSRTNIKNLVYSPKRVKMIRIIVAVVIGLILIGCLIYFIVASSNEETVVKSENAIDLEDVLSNNLAAKRFNGSWSGTHVIYKRHNHIMEYDAKTGTISELLEDKNNYILYEKSADGKLLLLAKNYKKNFRHSFEAEYDIYNISSKEKKALYVNSDQRSIIMAVWAPVGHGLILNFERNLYYKPNAFGETIVRLTETENPSILNGIPDWVYEEEVFSSNVATWFNPSGTKIAFIRFDDTPTHIINFPYYGEPGDLRYQYPYNRLVAYPKAGSSNPSVSLFMSDLDRAVQGLDHLTEVIIPSALNTETDNLITVVEWLNNSQLLSVWMNRIQNAAYMQVHDGLSRYEIYNIVSKTGWVDLYTPPLKNRDGTKIVLILPQSQNDGNEYRQLYLLPTTSANGKPEAITKGKFVVQSVLHWDTTSDIIFFTANTAENPEYLHIYAVKASSGQTPMCISCNLHKSGDVIQNYYMAEFNHDHQVVITSLGPGIPVTIIYEWTVSNSQVSLKNVLTWETNNDLQKKLENTAMPSLRIETIEIPNTGFDAKVLLQLPPNLDTSGKTQYPMLVDVYGGPDSYSVVNKWILDWGTYLSSNQSVIYAKIDGRGSGLRGDKLLHSIYQKLGTVEIDDQIEVTRQLQKNYNYIDVNRIGIWGWSYGGYAAAMALANGDVFKCAASIAPVTDWAYYDSIYTERYMGTPKTNEEGYRNARLSTRGEKLRGKQFLLVHGTLDDNVHYQQAMVFAKNLERHDILFKQISYPDEDHVLAGVRPHLYHSLDRFFGECFSNEKLKTSSK